MTKLKELKRKQEKKGLTELIDSVAKNPEKIVAGLIILAILVVGFAQLANQETTKNGKVKVTYYYSLSCAPCQAQEKVVDSVAKEFGEKIQLEKKCVVLEEEDPSKCNKVQGAAATQAFTFEARELSSSGVPVTKIGNQVLEARKTEKELRETICSELYGVSGILDLIGAKIKECKQN